MGRILVVDDEAPARAAIAEALASEGHTTRTAPNGAEALRILETFDPDVVLTDLQMPELDGIGLLEKGQPIVPRAAFVIMTAHASVDTAVEAIKKGAENYVTKPLDLDVLIVQIARAVEKAHLRKETASLREALADRFSLDNILGNHPSMQRLQKTIVQVAPSRATVLVQGESGTGKELIAAAIHHSSTRKNGPFVRLNCAALAESLLESELFGHERGSFTGAGARRQGKFEQANGGTLFLDEVSEIPPTTQVKLLRFLQERELERVGGNETIEVDVRVVAATNRDLAKQVEAGLFRQDLFYRLNVVRLDAPPLRVRRSDIPLLAHHFLEKYASENVRELKGFTDDALQKLTSYSWPGNVRELENAIERAVVLCQGERIGVEELGTTQPTTGAEEQLDLLVPGLSMTEIERIAIQRTLDAAGGSTARAAEVLGISRRKIQYRVKEWGLVDAEPGDAS